MAFEPLRTKIRVLADTGLVVAEAWETDPEILEAFSRLAARLHSPSQCVHVQRADFTFHPDRPTPVWRPVIDTAV